MTCQTRARTGPQSSIVIVARRANHVVVVAYARKCLSEYLRIASYVSCNDQPVSLEPQDGLALQEKTGLRWVVQLTKVRG